LPFSLRGFAGFSRTQPTVSRPPLKPHRWRISL
jgi:hypothetical protein